jgi:hypothetical protein
MIKLETSKGWRGMGSGGSLGLQILCGGYYGLWRVRLPLLSAIEIKGIAIAIPLFFSLILKIVIIRL